MVLDSGIRVEEQRDDEHQNEGCTSINSPQGNSDGTIIYGMRRQEKRYKCNDYLKMAASLVPPFPTFKEFKVEDGMRWRTKMCDWCFRTVNFFKLSRHSVHIAMSCLDRFLSIRATEQGCYFYLQSNQMYQLACVVCLYISIKVHEPVVLGADMIVQLCQGNYSKEQIHQTEYEILNTLQWSVNPPTTQSYIERFALQHGDTLLTHLLKNVTDDPADTDEALVEIIRSEVLSTSQRLCDVALADYKLSIQRSPCEVALSCFIVAMSTVCHVDTNQTTKDVVLASNQMFWGHSRNEHILDTSIIQVVQGLLQLTDANNIVHSNGVVDKQPHCKSTSNSNKKCTSEATDMSENSNDKQHHNDNDLNCVSSFDKATQKRQSYSSITMQTDVLHRDYSTYSSSQWGYPSPSRDIFHRLTCFYNNTF